jgi:hypothetical protein
MRGVMVRWRLLRRSWVGWVLVLGFWVVPRWFLPAVGVCFGEADWGMLLVLGFWIVPAGGGCFGEAGWSMYFFYGLLRLRLAMTVLRLETAGWRFAFEGVFCYESPGVHRHCEAGSGVLVSTSGLRRGNLLE